jgi:lysophospholipase L1-like esterase
MKKTIILYVTTLILIAVAIIVLIEGLFFVYTKVRGRPYTLYGGLGANIMDFQQAGLFVKDKKFDYILKPQASTGLLPGWKSENEEYDKKFHGLKFLISTNKDGYRGKSYPIQKSNNTLRILALGGSTTWGCFNDDGQAWPDFLESYLQDHLKNRDVQVINAAVGGYTSKHNLELLKYKYKYYEPDIVLIACWFNDMYIRGEDSLYAFKNTDFHVNRDYNKLQGTRTYPFPGLPAIYMKSKQIVDLIRFKMEDIDDLRNPPRRYFEKYYSKDKIWVRDYLANIIEIIRIAKEVNPRVKIYIIAMPSLLAPASKEMFKDRADLPDFDIFLYHRPYLADDIMWRFWFSLYYYHTVLFQGLLEPMQDSMGFKLILGYPALGRIPIRDRSHYFMDEMHLNGDGNKLLGREIGSQLLADLPESQK